MNEQELIYLMALTRQTRISSAQQQVLLQNMGSATAIFENRRDISRVMAEISPRSAQALAGMDDALPRCERELAYAREHHIKIIGYTDEAYPARLRNCEDAPVMLYSLGAASLNAQRVVSVVGTRNCTERGRDLCDAFVRDLSRLAPDTLVVSGLAYGIDVATHRACLDNNMSTVGVLAHGMDELYPRLHRSTAVEMLKNGGLLTEYMSQTRPEKMNFVQRNRIVAGIADAVIVVESASRGGSLITADMAFGYHRDVFAFPGRVADEQSEGCNLLIRNNKARLITSAEDFLNDMGWMPEKKTPEERAQGTLFPMLSPEEQQVADTMLHTDCDIDAAELASAIGIPLHRLTPIMIGLEMKGVVRLMAGNRYHLMK